ncbi:MAG: efflux RND transporter permease subunit [Pirellulaceae bacterium]
MTPSTPGQPAADIVTTDSFVLRHSKAILFLTAALCLAGAYCAYTMPASVFPQTDFPRVVILIDNGVMPADEMMATVTRPVEEAMKDIPGTANIRSTTGRGSAAVDVFFDWSTDMVQAELYVLGRLSQIRSTLPSSAEFAVHRLTFSAFPIIGISLTSSRRDITELWETARYDLNPRLLRIKGVARVNLVGGRVPEYHVVVDPVKLESYRLTLDQVSKALAATNQFTSAGMHEENRQLYLAVVDNRLRNSSDIENVVVACSGKSPVYIRDLATVRRGYAPQYNIVTAEGTDAVLLNVYGQPDSNTVSIAGALQEELQRIRQELPVDMKLAFFYDQSLFVQEGVRSVWECIVIGLVLSIIVLYLFLRSLSGALVVGAGIPVTVLVTLVIMRIFHMSFNLMTLGGIAAAIGMVIDDAIVVVEAIHAKLLSGQSAAKAIRSVTREVGPALVGSTLTPVVVFIPLAFLDGVAGVFFRALALTMVSALLTSLVVAVTFTPALAALVMRHRDEEPLTRIALAGHPDIQTAVAQANISHAAVGLARAERIPITSIGPLYERGETGTTFYSLAVDTQIPILNPGRRLVWQREAEHRRDLVAAEQARVRITAAVKASLAKWLRTRELVAEVGDTAETIKAQTQKMERLYTAGQTDLLKLLQVRQRLIEAENANLDMLWQATQAYADLLDATGATPLLGALSVAADQPAGATEPTSR